MTHQKRTTRRQKRVGGTRRRLESKQRMVATQARCGATSPQNHGPRALSAAAVPQHDAHLPHRATAAPHCQIDVVLLRGGTVIVVACGEIDIATAPHLDSLLRDAESTDARALVVDLDAVTFMDAAGLAVLIRHALSDQRDERLKITDGSPQVRRLFELTGLDTRLPSMGVSRPCEAETRRWCGDPRTGRLLDVDVPRAPPVCDVRGRGATEPWSLVTSSHSQRLSVLIAGGGVAALEAALALRDLAGERIDATLIAPEEDFVDRPMRVGEPFGGSRARRYPLEPIARDIGVKLKRDAIEWLDPNQPVVHTEGGMQISYDALLLALGARLHPRFRHALTLDDRRLDEQLHGLIQDVEAGYARKLAFLAPTRIPWPLVLYELALTTAQRAWDMNGDVSITLITPEDAPLAIFGSAVSEAVGRLLTDHGIRFIASVTARRPSRGRSRSTPEPGGCTSIG